MAVTFDSSSNGSASSGTTVTVSHTVASGACLLVGVVSTDAGVTVSSVTYNGSALTAVSGATSSAGTITEHKHYIISNPSTGTNNIVVTMSGTITGTVRVLAASYIGADSTAPVSNAIGDNVEDGLSSPSGAIHGNITPQKANSYLVETVANGSGFTLAYRNSQTQRTASGNNTIADKKITTATAQDMGVDWGGLGSGNRCVVVSSIQSKNRSLSVSDSAVKSESMKMLRGRKFRIVDSSVHSEVIEIVKNLWASITKSANTFVNQAKNSSTFSNISKSISSWNNQNKS